MGRPQADDAGFLQVIVGDGRPLLLITAGSLIFAGGFALFLAASRQLLLQDVQYLGMTAAELCELRSCQILDFMVHDRASFGGTLLGLGVLYVWLTVFPLSRREQWAWWTWLVSGAVGFATFLAYLGFATSTPGTASAPSCFFPCSPGEWCPRDAWSPSPWIRGDWCDSAGASTRRPVSRALAWFCWPVPGQPPSAG